MHYPASLLSHWSINLSSWEESLCLQIPLDLLLWGGIQAAPLAGLRSIGELRELQTMSWKMISNGKQNSEWKVTEIAVIWPKEERVWASLRNGWEKEPWKREVKGVTVPQPVGVSVGGWTLRCQGLCAPPAWRLCEWHLDLILSICGFNICKFPCCENVLKNLLCFYIQTCV